MSLLQSTFSIWDNTPICSRNGTACAHSESLQCPIDNQQQQLQAVDLANTDEAFAMLGGTLVAALLVYAILPYVRARTSSSRRGQSKAQSPMSMDRRRRCSNQSGMLSTSTALNGAGRRVRQTLFGDDVGEVESAGGGRDGRRSKGGSRRRDVAGSATGSEPLLAILPAFNDEQGWREFFDAQIYNNGRKEERRAAATIVSAQIASREMHRPKDTVVAAPCIELCSRKVENAAATGTKGERYRTVRDRIRRAATKAAIDDAQMFNEFWQM
uniref:Uncharacterized protein n=1 Tax=Hyaloperonospora arabidopsidis (strain Emoy2) TaxID=559515 RepID=M4B6B4_HYAAE